MGKVEAVEDFECTALETVCLTVEDLCAALVNDTGSDVASTEPIRQHQASCEMISSYVDTDLQFVVPHQALPLLSKHQSPTIDCLKPSLRSAEIARNVLNVSEVTGNNKVSGTQELAEMS